MEQSPAKNTHFRVLGVTVSAIQIPEVISCIETWIRRRRGTSCIAVTGMHGVMEAQQDPGFKAILNRADLVVPDGMPLVWLSRLRGCSLKRRVYGPELMLTFCEQTVAKGYRHFFYGGAPGVAEQLASTLTARYPGMQVAGTYTPPFRPLTPQEEQEVVAAVRSSGPDILWVGLSTPKQERWMHAFRERLGVPVLVGVGAAFDLNTGRVPQAPRWMQEHGLEWLYRLLQEPRRLWRRYLVFGPRFVFFVILESLHLKKFD